MAIVVVDAEVLGEAVLGVVLDVTLYRELRSRRLGGAGRRRRGLGDLQVRGDLAHRDRRVVVVVCLLGLAHRVARVHEGADVAGAVLRPGRDLVSGRVEVARGPACHQVGGDRLFAKLDAPRGGVGRTEVVRQLEVGGHLAGVVGVGHTHPAREQRAHRGGAAGGRELRVAGVEVRPLDDADGVVAVVVVVVELGDLAGCIGQHAQVARAVDCRCGQGQHAADVAALLPRREVVGDAGVGDVGAARGLGGRRGAVVIIDVEVGGEAVE